MTPGAPRLCRKCGKRPVPPSLLKHGDYLCSNCRNRRPCAKGCLHRYRRSAKGKAYMARSNARRLYVGHVYHSYVADADQAAAIQTHIKERRREFEQGQQNREKAEGPAAG